MTDSATFLCLAEVHGRLGRLFVDHQLALTELDLERAAHLLDRFSEGVRAHAAHEEDVLIPVYEERVEPTRGGTVEILRSEHRKILGYLDEFLARVRALRRDDPGVRRQTLALIDDQRIFKQLMLHHGEREEKTLYPCLDEVCSQEERRRMLQAGEPA